MGKPVADAESKSLKFSEFVHVDSPHPNATAPWFLAEMSLEATSHCGERLL